MVDRSMNGQSITCYVLVNSSMFYQAKRFTVFYGPYDDHVTFSGRETGVEGYGTAWVCYGGFTNPAVSITWYNGSTEFSPDTPLIVDKYSNYYYTRQEWKVKYHRDYTGNNISCVVRGSGNRTVTKTKQFGDILYDPDLVVGGSSVVEEGDTLNLTCEVVAANPMTIASWSGRVGQSLVISDIKRNQNGNSFTCSAQNSAGRSYEKVTITVQPRPSLEIVGAVHTTSGGSWQINGIEGENLTLTCKSDLSSLTLEYASVVYNNTENDSGTYTVTLIKNATKSDDDQVLKCRATNATGQELEKIAVVHLASDVIDVTLDGVGTVEENDVVNISCTVSRTHYQPTNIGIFSFNPINPDINNVSLYTTTTVYDNVTETYTTTLLAPPITVDSSMNSQSIFCYGLVNSSRFSQVKRFTVLYGPYDNQVSLYGRETGVEGNRMTWICYGGFTNPALSITWYNGSTEFSPDTPAIVDKYGDHYYTRQEWNFKYHRDYTGNNISCVVRGSGDRTVTKTKQFGDILYDPDLVVGGSSVVEEGATLNLTCEVVAANPMTTASWSGGVGQSLVISDIKRNQNGNMFSCSAQNSAGRSYLGVTITVQYGPELNVMSELSYKEGVNATIYGSVSANPPATLAWRRAGNSTVLSTDGDLFLENVSRDQAGVYVLEATSVKQRGNNTLQEVTRNASTILEVMYGPGSSVGLSPNVTVLEVEQGAVIPRITCVADCVPDCDYQWTREYRNTMWYRSGATLSLGNATVAEVGIHTCKASNYVRSQRYEQTVTFELRVKYAPEVQSVSLDRFTGNPYNDGSPISVTSVIRAWPSVDSVTWGITNDRFTNQFMPLDSRYITNRTVNCSYDCEITEVLTLQTPDCTDTGNKFSLYAANEQGNSTIKTSLNLITISCSPRLADRDTANQTYRVCEGSPINMSARFISVPGPTLLWYHLPDTTRYVHMDRYNRFSPVYYTTTYSIQAVYKYMFGSYVVEADNYRGTRVRAYIELLEDCSTGSVPITTTEAAITTETKTSTDSKITDTASPQKSGDSGAIAGAVVGSLLLVALVVIGTLVYIRYRRKRKGNQKFEQLDLRNAQNY
ncbi:uncharacterized protein LOC134232252 isoform X2 [Saccostrea cucullata]|uniref:uncharacterized protein LOC134232252 isoform X2 n=1 Tax=Saccostrea cuccullata TaxID=36930 RepID=UPI002ED298E3